MSDLSAALGPGEARTEGNTSPPSTQSLLPPTLPPRKALLGLPTFKRLLEEVLAIEGPCPPERFQKVIGRLKQEKKWVDSSESFKSVFAPDAFEPASDKSKGAFLYLASYLGDEESVQAALAAGADVDWTIPGLGDCPFNAAMVFDHTSVIETLLKAGSSILRIATARGTNEQKYFLEALETISAKTVRVILTYRGKDALPSDAVLAVAAKGECSILKVLYEKEFDFCVTTAEGATALHLAARHNQRETVQYLLSLGFPVDAVDGVTQTPLYDAVLNLHGDMVALLLDNDAKINRADVNGDTPVHVLLENPKDADGFPLTHEVITNQKLLILQMLCVGGAILEHLNNAGQAPLHVAVRYALGEMAAVLIAHGADCETRDSNGWTPLHLCAAGQGQQPQIAVLLIEQGASLKARLPLPTPLTPLDLAKRIASASMVNLFQEARRERGISKWFARRGIA